MVRNLEILDLKNTCMYISLNGISFFYDSISEKPLFPMSKIIFLP